MPHLKLSKNLSATDGALDEIPADDQPESFFSLLSTVSLDTALTLRICSSTSLYP